MTGTDRADTEELETTLAMHKVLQQTDGQRKRKAKKSNKEKPKKKKRYVPHEISSESSGEEDSGESSSSSNDESSSSDNNWTIGTWDKIFICPIYYNKIHLTIISGKD